MRESATPSSTPLTQSPHSASTEGPQHGCGMAVAWLQHGPCAPSHPWAGCVPVCFPRLGGMRVCVCMCVCVHVCMCVSVHVCATPAPLQNPAQLHPSHPDLLIYNKTQPSDTSTLPAPKSPTCSPGDTDTNPSITHNHPRAPQPSPPLPVPAWGSRGPPGCQRCRAASFPRLAPARGSPAVQLIYERRIFQAPFPFHCCFSCWARFRPPLNNSCHAASGEKGSE